MICAGKLLVFNTAKMFRQYRHHNIYFLIRQKNRQYRHHDIYIFGGTDAYFSSYGNVEGNQKIKSKETVNKSNSSKDAITLFMSSTH